ncbi:receptor expression-enhancing protein 5-like isoform X2 [Leucoraja erinacea]|uniref:receptor expression-enhancing protein 5-like isoform X2 n=1 Tax=Leucoraja erinaceus TaxID=7782 RepID=UPI002454F2CD|nr:receptor expression-enhancing protein 5-like isoform X2 [Leucoraja erinacea]
MSVSVSRFVYTLFALIALSSLLGYGASLFPLANVVVFLFPAYFSVLAIESANKQEKLKWLMYWVIYGAFAIVECTAGILLYVIPSFQKLKTIFLLWCMAPVDWNGSYVIYTNIIRPFFYKAKPKVEELSTKVSEAVDNIKPQGKIYQIYQQWLRTSPPQPQKIYHQWLRKSPPHPQK